MNPSAAGLADLIQSAADWFFMPWVVVVLLGTGLFLTIRTGVVQLRRFGDACRVAFVRQGSGARRRAHAVPGVHDRRWRRRSAPATSPASRPRSSRAVPARCSGSGSTGSSRPRSSSPKPCWASLSARRAATDVLSGPMYYLRDGLQVAGARLDLRVRRGGRGADDHAVHAAELDGAGAEQRRRHSAARFGRRRSRC